MAHLIRKLEEDFTKLVQQAKANGFTDAEIDECIGDVLNDPTACSSNYCSRFIWKCISLSFRVFFFFIFLSVLGYTFILYAPRHVSIRVETPIAPYFYIFQRIMRTVALPFHDYMNISQYYTAPCFVPNPLHVPTEDKEELEAICDLCRKVHGNVTQLDNATTSAEGAYTGESIVVFLNYLPIITIAELDAVYRSNNDRIDVMSEGKNYTDLSSVVTSPHPTADRSDFRATWATPTINLAPLIEKPPYIPQDTPTPENTTFFVLAPLARHYSLGEEADKVRVVVQMDGAAEVSLSPLEEDCKDLCGKHRVILHAGHSIAYHPFVWRAFIMAHGTKEVYSLSYTQDFSYVIEDDDGNVSGNDDGPDDGNAGHDDDDNEDEKE